MKKKIIQKLFLREKKTAKILYYPHHSISLCTIFIDTNNGASILSSTTMFVADLQALLFGTISYYMPFHSWTKASHIYK